MQLEPASKWERVFDRAARDLMPKENAVVYGPQHPGGHALLDRDRRARDDRVEQPEFGVGHYDRHRLESLLRCRPEPSGAGEYGIPDRHWNLRVPGREHLRDKKRVATGLPVQIVGVDFVALRLGERPNRVGRQRRNLDPQRSRAHRNLAKETPKRMPTIELVIPEGRDDQNRKRLDPPDDDPEHIK
jgi:hypothetical protein